MRSIVILMLLASAALGQPSLDVFHKGTPLLDAHNCYPYEGKWADRIDRALSTGFPLGIEQDLTWYVDPKSKAGRSVVSHGGELKGDEPGLREHFFEKVRPSIEAALAKGDKQNWPVIVVHFDFKTSEPEHLAAVWKLLGEYESWVTTAPKGKDPSFLETFDSKPLLVLTEDNDAHEAAFFNQVPVGGKLRIFGSAHTSEPMVPQGATDAERARLWAAAQPSALLKSKATNYRRWWNASWAVIEEGGQRKAGDWTSGDAARLKAIVDHAHRMGYWMRFYTLNGHSADQNKGWSQSYNFGSLEAVRLRWRAAVETGVNLIATDQYEDFAGFLRGNNVPNSR